MNTPNNKEEILNTIADAVRSTGQVTNSAKREVAQVVLDALIALPGFAPDTDRMAELESDLEQVSKVLRDLLERVDDTVSYVDQEDEIGSRPCCGALSYESHRTDCEATKARIVLKAQLAKAKNTPPKPPGPH